MFFDVLLDASKATLEINNHICKPAGRELSVSFIGTLENKTWQLTANQIRLQVGKNYFSASGSVENLQQFLRGTNVNKKIQTSFALLTKTDWQGQWKITDLASINDILIGLSKTRKSILEDVHLNGTISGKWSIRHTFTSILDKQVEQPNKTASSASVRIKFEDIRIPAKTRFKVGNLFVKPDDKPMNLELSCNLSTAPPRLDNFQIHAEIGQSVVNLQQGELTFQTENNITSAKIAGIYTIVNPGNLLDCIPPASLVNAHKKQNKWSESISGSVKGRFKMIIGPIVKRLHLYANALQLQTKWNNSIIKAKGQPADITIDFLADRFLPPDERNRVALQIDLASATVETVFTYPARNAARDTIIARSKVIVSDAAWLCQQIPLLKDTFNKYQPVGSLVLTFYSRLKQESFSGQVLLDADDLEFQFPPNKPNQKPRIKPRGKALRLRLAGEINKDIAKINAFTLDIGKSSLFVQGAIKLDKSRNISDNSYLPPGIVGANLYASARIVIDPVSRELFAEFDKIARQYHLAGVCQVNADLKANSKFINIHGKANATAMNISVNNLADIFKIEVENSNEELTKKSPFKENLEKEVEKILSHITKPTGEKLIAQYNLSIPVNFSSINIRNFTLATKAIKVQGAGNIPLLSGDKISAHIAVNIPELHQLAIHAPYLVEYKLAGSSFIESEFQLDKRKNLSKYKYVTINLKDILAQIGNKKCYLNGTVGLEDIVYQAVREKQQKNSAENKKKASSTKIGKFHTDALEFAIGKNHGFIVGTVNNPQSAATGKIAILCTYIDQHDLQQWLNLCLTEVRNHPHSKTKGKLSASDIFRLRKEADEKIASLKNWLSKANLRCHIYIKRFQYLDKSTLAWYEVNDLICKSNFVNGTIKANFIGGLNGGGMEQKIRIDTTTSRPIAQITSNIIKVIPRENILLQLAQEFPGNTVYGSFSQWKKVEYSLRDLLMSISDARYRPIAIGNAKTVAVDGMIRGKAAPKWMARFFPGLNLTTYRYRKMTGFAEYLPDGTVKNDMIFSGPVYDIYICGTTDMNGIARYEIGLILLGTPQSPEFNHRLRQGRIIILKFRARIANRRFYDEEISYPLPTETAYKIFLENNIFYRLWLAAGKKQKTTSIITNNQE
ncbi:MAG: hypothetical protein J7L99_01865 [Planctomycetes bacterium]|nr:hypothetical protein [Planctomycetota bacterium]